MENFYEKQLSEKSKFFQRKTTRRLETFSHFTLQSEPEPTFEITTLKIIQNKNADSNCGTVYDEGETFKFLLIK